MTEDLKKEIVELLENLTYWDTCPQNYKDRIPTMIEALKQGQSLPIDSVSNSGCDPYCTYSRAMNQPRPRLCVKCKKPETN